MCLQFWDILFSKKRPIYPILPWLLVRHAQTLSLTVGCLFRCARQSRFSRCVSRSRRLRGGPGGRSGAALRPSVQPSRPTSRDAGCRRHSWTASLWQPGRRPRHSQSRPTEQQRQWQRTGRSRTRNRPPHWPSPHRPQGLACSGPTIAIYLTSWHMWGRPLPRGGAAVGRCRSSESEPPVSGAAAGTWWGSAVGVALVAV